MSVAYKNLILPDSNGMKKYEKVSKIMLQSIYSVGISSKLLFKFEFCQLRKRLFQKTTSEGFIYC